MTSRRVQKAAEAIREVVSMAILTDLKDPRVADVTVTYVEVSPDMRHAKVHVSVMGDDAKQELCLHGLRNSSGYLQKKISKRIDTRYTPRIRFELDMGVKRSIEITQILNDVLPDQTPSTDVTSADVTSTDVTSADVTSGGDADAAPVRPASVVTDEATESDFHGEAPP